MLILQSLYLLAAVLAGSTTLTRAAHSSDSMKEPLCRSAHIATCRNKEQCIPRAWECDGVQDCQDGSDELSCHGPKFTSPTCASGEGKCGVGANASCVHVTKWCDGNNDCGNNADETFCIQSIHSPGEKYLYCQPFSQPQFYCRNQGSGRSHSERCIPWKLRCDGRPHCPDGSDESAAVCNATTPVSDCNSKQFQCKHNNHCISEELRCNGVNDCGDGSDEVCDHLATTQPPIGTCSHLGRNVWCANRINCIKFFMWCDGVVDCPDRSDEANCSSPRLCTQHEVKCKTRQYCVKAASLCDGGVDCGDGSDEENCKYRNGNYNSSTCPGFWCDNKCRDKEVRCNGVHDCHSHQDDEKDCPSVLPHTTKSDLGQPTQGAVERKSSDSSSDTIIIAVAVAGGILLLLVIIGVVLYKNVRAEKKDVVMTNKAFDGVPAPNMEDATHENGSTSV